MKKVIRFELLNETQGAYRYQEVDADGTPLITDADGAHIGALYLRKGKFSEAPAFVTVTVENATVEGETVLEKVRKSSKRNAKGEANPFEVK